jgi:hypothetical protein
MTMETAALFTNRKTSDPATAAPSARGVGSAGCTAVMRCITASPRPAAVIVCPALKAALVSGRRRRTLPRTRAAPNTVSVPAGGRSRAMATKNASSS